MNKVTMGIDPGLSGGIVVLDDIEIYECTKMPLTERDIWEIFEQIRDESIYVFAYIERVHSMPKQGVTSTFTFGQNYGMLRGFLIAAGISFEEVTPQKWQRYWGLPALKACGDSITKKKNVHKAKAQQLFPAVKVTHAVTDALLIAERGRRIKSELQKEMIWNDS